MSGKQGQARRPQCLLCGVALNRTTAEYILLHPPSQTCKVQLTELTGVSIDDQYELIAGEIYMREEPAEPEPDLIMAFPQWTPVEKVLVAMFEAYNVPYLGGASGDRGWSSFALYQRCPYLWYRTHVEPLAQIANGELDPAEPFGRAVGSVLHVLLAVHYQKKIQRGYAITPEIVREYLSANHCDPAVVDESWRLFAPYRLFYKHEKIKPLAVEYHLVDPRTKESTRYDLIAEVLDGYEGREPGTYIVDHKSAQRFDQPTLFGWVNDGTIIQQAMLWQRLGLDRRFGVLKGIIVNIIGKQKVPELHRTWVSPNRWQIDQQTTDLRVWQGHKALALATGVFPRSRANCIHRYGMCDLFEHCATGEG